MTEYVTIGHPDRIADLLAAKLIEAIQRKDQWNAHAAIEVLITGNKVVFSGEARTSLKLTKKFLKNEIVIPVLNDCGYRDRGDFSKSQKIISSEYKVINLIQSQSPDIKEAVFGENNDLVKWNDQGIFYAGYDPITETGQSKEKFLAQKIGDYLFEVAKKNPKLGTDIKVLINNNEITVAIPSLLGEDITKKMVEVLVCQSPVYLYDFIKSENVVIKVNTSGKYISHGSIADTGLTGRKLAVNSLSPINQNGGGSMIKPVRSADLLVPLFLFNRAKKIALDSKAEVNLEACCEIGKDTLPGYIGITPRQIIEDNDLLNNFYDLVKRNFV